MQVHVKNQTNENPICSLRLLGMCDIQPLMIMHVYCSMRKNDATYSILADLAAQSAGRSYVPYSDKEEGCVILLEDGSVVHGCRVENASFQLTISALINAWTTLHAVGRVDVVAIVQSQPFTAGEKAWLSEMPEFDWQHRAATVITTGDALPEPTETLSPLMEDWGVSPSEGIERARFVSDLAHTPQSDFPVGSVVRTGDNKHVPGVNVEHSDWSQILCAERNALSSSVAYGYGTATEIFVSCLKDPGGTPCGACRQVMAELAPQATVWIDMSTESPISMSVAELLPGAFTGAGLRSADGS
jgi:cytidine deaminase